MLFLQTQIYSGTGLPD
uniref:Uncharacterized protein n=1 Tax=Arundo donax TaxID=35708 RepID=A0A0A9CA47_ARUDO